MTNKQAANLILNLTADIGKREHKDLWHYLESLYKVREMLEVEDEWTLCSECLPEELQEVNVTWKYDLPEPQYCYFTKGFPFVGTAIYYNGKWYWDLSPACNIPEECEEVDNDILIIAWKPLPKPYKKD